MGSKAVSLFVAYVFFPFQLHLVARRIKHESTNHRTTIDSTDRYRVPLYTLFPGWKRKAMSSISSLLDAHRPAPTSQSFTSFMMTLSRSSVASCLRYASRSPSARSSGTRWMRDQTFSLCSSLWGKTDSSGSASEKTRFFWHGPKQAKASDKRSAGSSAE